MSYLVLARKYRPQRFGEMSGQDHVVRTLRNALKSGQLAHAFLFTGPRGVGKTTSARLVAKALNCEQGPTASTRCRTAERWISSRRIDDQILIRVKDTGVGIAEGLDVFDLFMTTKRDGTGLGLSIARQIVEAHGGSISYESVVGEGTTFSVTRQVA